MNNLLERFKKNLFSSIAFYPTIVAVLLVSLGVALLALERTEFIQDVYALFPFLVLKDSATARSILTALTGGVFSLLVFSFSMVMIVLNQASNNFSPRLLPGLISEKNHQFVLGSYIGFLAYCLMVLSWIEEDAGPPSIAVLMAVLGGITSLGVFIFFINRISAAIRIDNIVYRIYQSARIAAVRRQKNDPGKPMVSTSDLPVVLPARSNGFFQGINKNRLLRIANEHHLRLRIVPVIGTMVLEGEVLCKLNQLPDGLDLDEFFDCFYYNEKDLPLDDFDAGIRHLTEIAVRAMSPGINDPATAVSAIDYLTGLFLFGTNLPGAESFEYSDESEAVVSISSFSFKERFRESMAYLRLYCSHDVNLVLKLIEMLNRLEMKAGTGSSSISIVIASEKENLRADLDRNIKNKADVQVAMELLNGIEKPESKS
ncbi:MAG: DUF2254 domain-containing protein [Bacteroidetes bacterium]|nr:DUF2254 domain-containing protein [Bacteroidota bacterium]